MAEFWDDDEGRNPAHTTAEMLAEYVDVAEGHVGVWDFGLKTTMQQAALKEDFSLLGSKEGLPGLMGIRPHLAFTYIDNHDTAPPQVRRALGTYRSLMGPGGDKAHETRWDNEGL